MSNNRPHGQSKARSKSKEKDRDKDKKSKEPQMEKRESKRSSQKKDNETSTTKKTSSKSASGKENASSVEEKKRKNEKKTKPQDDEYEYEDDFEDYSDDFEDDEEIEEKKGEVKPIVHLPNPSEKDKEPLRDNSPKSDPGPAPSREMPSTIPPYLQKDDQNAQQGLQDENMDSPMIRRLKSSKSSRPIPLLPAKEREKTSRIPSAGQRRLSLNSSNAPQMPINFGDNGEAAKRHGTLRGLIGIEAVSLRILDKAPVKDYDLYVEMFGESGKAQTHTQTGDDDISEEVQTEEAIREHKWTQWPSHDGFGWGAEALTAQREYGLHDADLDIFKENPLQNQRLKEFLEAAAQVVIDLITSRHRKGEYIEMQNRSELKFSAGYNTLNLKTIAQSAKCCVVHGSRHDEGVLLVAFVVVDSPIEEIQMKSLLVEFPFDQTNTTPQRVFLCESEVRCCVYSPDGAALFAGLSDGSCVTWDLREPAATFPTDVEWGDSGELIPLRLPAYDTAFLSSTFSPNSKNASAIHVSIASKSTDATCQVAVLDEGGTVSIWSLLRDADTSNNLGVRPGARLVIGLSALLRPDSAILSASSNPTFLIANCMQSYPKDPSQFIVGTDIGFLLSMSRTKGNTYSGPRLYRANMNVFGEIICLRFSPFDLNLFVAGLSTGSLSFHSKSIGAPLLILTPPNDSRAMVTAIEWSPSLPTVLYSIHENGRILTWDLAVGSIPIAVGDLRPLITGRIVSTYVWFSKPHSQSKGISYMAFAVDSGEAHVHALENVASRGLGEYKTVTALLKKV